MKTLQLDRITAINGDCMDYMKSLPDKAFDLTITSPPYNLGNRHHTGNNQFSPYSDEIEELEYQTEQLYVLNELYRITSDKGSLFYNHKNRIRNGFQISPYEWIFKSKWKIKQEIVWINRSQNFDKCRFYPMTERIYWLSKDKDTSFSNNSGLKDYNYWKPVGTKGFHKRAFPLDMVHDILKCFPSSQKVLDPYGGSFTTAIACHNLGFELTIIEKDEDYFNQAINRLKWHQRQQVLQFE